jgi:hypothetical protein
MANFYGATGLIGGASGDLDNIDGTNLASADGALVITSAAAYIYYMNATSGAAESSPDVISPDANAGNKRWELVDIVGEDAVMELLKLYDTNKSHTLSVKWNENDTGDRVLNLLVAGGDRSLTLNESLVVGDGEDGTITFSVASKVLTIAESLTIQTASATAVGLSELATDAETVTGTATDRVTTPANVTAKMAAPGAIGGTTPAAITGTTITGTGVMTVSPDGTNEVFQVNDGTIDFTDGNAGTTGTLTIASDGDLTYNKNIYGGNAAGPAIINEAATTTNPTLVPNKAEEDTGIGWASDTLHIALGGASEYSFSTTVAQFSDNILQRPVIKDYGETVSVLGALGGGTDNIDLESGNVVTATFEAGAQTVTFTNPPASGTLGSVTLIATNAGLATITWTAVDWEGGTAPDSLTSSGVDILVFWTIDAATTVHGAVASLDSK